MTAATTTESQEARFSYKQATHDEVLEDLSRHALPRSSLDEANGIHPVDLF